MRRKRLLVTAALLSTLLIFPLALGANVINVADLPFLGGPVTSSSSTVFVDPPHVLNETLQAGSNFTVHLNVSDVNDLFTWQVNIDWNSSILNVSRIVPGKFLAKADNQTSSEALSEVLGYDMVINSTENAQGYSSFSESILGNVTGISGNGTLVSIEFLVLSYGYTNLTISNSGTPQTMLLDSTGGSITLAIEDGQFRNLIPGDMVGDISGSYPDGDVDRYDFSDFADTYGSVKGQPNYNWLADLVGDTSGSLPDGDIDRYDFSIFADNYGRKM